MIGKYWMDTICRLAFLDVETKGSQYASWLVTGTIRGMSLDKSHGLSAGYVRVGAGRMPLLFYEEYLDDETEDDEAGGKRTCWVNLSVSGLANVKTLKAEEKTEKRILNREGIKKWRAIMVYLIYYLSIRRKRPWSMGVRILHEYIMWLKCVFFEPFNIRKRVECKRQQKDTEKKNAEKYNTPRYIYYTYIIK